LDLAQSQRTSGWSREFVEPIALADGGQACDLTRRRDLDELQRDLVDRKPTDTSG